MAINSQFESLVEQAAIKFNDSL